MSEYEGVEDVEIVADDMSHDPFDDVVEIEPVEVSDEVDTEDVVEQSSEEAEDSEVEDSEESEETDGSEDPIDDVEEVKAESDEDDGEVVERTLDGIDKQIEDGSLEFKINDEDVTLKDLKNDYIGQKEISKRFTEHDLKSKQLDADTNEINGYIETFAGKLKDGDSIGAMQFFGEFAGVAPHMIKEQLIAALAPEIMRRGQMSEVEINNETLQQENEYLQQQRESETQRSVAEQADKELQNSINSIRETNNIDEQTWNDTSSYLEKNLPEGEQLTPELVTSTIKYGQMYEQAENVINLSGESLENKDQWIEELVNVKEKYPDFNDDDLKEVLASALETTRKDSVEQKMAKKVSSKGATSKKVIKQTAQSAEDIDPELEDWL